MRLLLIKDEDDCQGPADELAKNLSRNGYEVRQVHSGKAALAHEPVDLILLDRDLPDLNGHEICRRLRASSAVPIIMMSRRADDIQKILALHTGADDYIIEPFSFYELLARIEAVMRRFSLSQLPAWRSVSQATGEGGPDVGPAQPQGDRRSTISRLGRLCLDQRQRKVFLNGEPLVLTRKEFNILAVLIEDPGALVTRETLLSRVWDENWFGSTRTVDAHVSHLRAKLCNGRWVETVRGVGFRLVDPGE
jgi:two-component system, OmpR family, response regulator RegX3